MDLFVVNRHENEPVNEAVNEEANLARVLKVIERNKKRKKKQKETSRKRGDIIAKVTAQRQRRREAKAKIVPIPENQISDNDEHVPSDQIQKERKSNKKKVTADPSSIDGFTILGGDDFAVKPKVKRILPKWLSNPVVISVNLQNLETKVSEMKELDKRLRKELKRNKIKYFFPVQAQVIPWLLKANKHANFIFPRDVCVSAPTGSGKTLAFALPIIQALMHHTIRKIRALIILPTQELAKQVFKTFIQYSQDINLAICLITGQSPFMNEQKELVYENEAFGYLSKVDILVCTAGRLVEHIKSTRGFDLHNLEFLVIDEADRVLDNIQNDWLYHLEKHINNVHNSQFMKVLNLCTLRNHRPPQKLLFSATLSQDPEKLQKLTLFQPKLFTSIVESGDSISLAETTYFPDKFLGKYTTPNELTEKYIVCSMDLKPLILYHFIKMEKLTKTLVFTHSTESVHRLKILLRAMFRNDKKIEEISSNLENKYRNSLIEKFSTDEIDILVCTDSLARGIDLAGVKCVISYSAPKYLKTYIHRVGRTARAGHLGLAVTILHKSQLNYFQNLLKQADKNNLSEVKISEEDIEPLGAQYRDALNDLKFTVDKEEKKELRKIKSVKRSTNYENRKRKHSIGET